MPTTPSAFGKYLRTQRKAARLSQAELGKALRLTQAYISQVETGVLGPFSPESWPAIVKAIPGATLAELQRTAALSQALEIDLTKTTPAQSELALALALCIRERSLTDDEVAPLLDLLRSVGAAPVRAHGRVVDGKGVPVTGRAYVYRLSSTRGWSALIGVRAHAGYAAGPCDGRNAVLVGKSFDLLGGKDPRGAGFFDVPGGLPPGEYALDIHPTGGSGAESWAWPLVVTAGGTAQNVPIVCTAAPPSISPSKRPGTSSTKPNAKSSRT